MEKFLIFLMTLLVALVVCIFTGWITMLLWNWLIVKIFGLTAITYIEGVGLNLLGGLLFGGNKVSANTSK